MFSRWAQVTPIYTTTTFLKSLLENDPYKSSIKDVRKSWGSRRSEHMGRQPKVDVCIRFKI